MRRTSISSMQEPQMRPSMVTPRQEKNMASATTLRSSGSVWLPTME